MAQPYSLNEVQILEHFLEMEKHFRRQTERQYFPSLNYFLNEEKDKLRILTEEVENMVYFVGLNNIPVKINLNKLNNAAALINLAESSFIDITIDEEIYKQSNNQNYYIIFSALAHELGHFILKRHGIYYTGFMDFENEIYADLSTFYLGFGEFVMEGYKYTDNNNTIHQMGYLTPESYAMAFTISEFLNGKKPNAYQFKDYNTANLIAKAVLRCKTKWIKSISNENDIKEYYKTLCINVGTITLLIDILNNIIDNEKKSIREYINSLNQNFLILADSVPLDYRKIAVVLSTFTDSTFINYSGEKEKSILIQILALIFELKGINIDDYLSSIKHKCPHCGSIINNPSFETNDGKRIYHFRCSKCKTQFAIDNNIPQVKLFIQNQLNTIKRDRNIIKNAGFLLDRKKELEEKEARWKSMNWWQRLWHKG